MPNATFRHRQLPDGNAIPGRAVKTARTVDVQSRVGRKPCKWVLATRTHRKTGYPELGPRTGSGWPVSPAMRNTPGGAR